ncbi:hypothetical protein SAMN02910447_01656 [Ruminococcus sp. YE71]|uniref:hypothetical protein n=1 Tax=unclassified Ruminococcus TaxID=2608920 RepID=UPI00088F688C|nr:MULTISPECIES: hypothetical protein [unclassified Ruminococcus]SDA19957.1 hypothetical protein SAMN02910446_01657 [Ruminococcus sp. YE78]SFW31641.1 hypothetical protein SAMN02910447_01656 [Ruminococcus sp. YE71]
MESKSKLAKLIDEVDFYNAYEIYARLSDEQKHNEIIVIANNTNNVKVLGFMSFVLQNDPSYINHSIMYVAYNQMCWVPCAYSLALYHAKEMYRLRHDMDAMTSILFLWDMPFGIVSDDFAWKIVNKALAEDDSNKFLLEVYDKLKDKTFDFTENIKTGNKKAFAGLIDELDYHKAYKLYVKMTNDQKHHEICSSLDVLHQIKVIAFMTLLLSNSPTYENYYNMFTALNQMDSLDGTYELACFYKEEMKRFKL